MNAEDRLKLINDLLTDAYDSDAMDYDLQGVNVAHRIAAGGQPPRDTESVARDNEGLSGEQE